MCSMYISYNILFFEKIAEYDCVFEACLDILYHWSIKHKEVKRSNLNVGVMIAQEVIYLISSNIMITTMQDGGSTTL